MVRGGFLESPQILSSPPIPRGNSLLESWEGAKLWSSPPFPAPPKEAEWESSCPLWLGPAEQDKGPNDGPLLPPAPPGH